MSEALNDQTMLERESRAGDLDGVSPTLAGAAWFALRVKPQREKLVAGVIQNKGYEQMLPLYRERHQWSDRIKEVEMPLFPGYVFCRLNPQSPAPLLTTPGVLYIVAAGNIPLPIPDPEVAGIRTLMASRLPVEPCGYLKVGEEVVVQRGTLMGLRGILLRARSGCRVVVSVHLLERSVSVEVDRDWVALVRPLPARLQAQSAQSKIYSIATGAG